MGTWYWPNIWSEFDETLWYYALVVSNELIRNLSVESLWGLPLGKYTQKPLLLTHDVIIHAITAIFTSFNSWWSPLTTNNISSLHKNTCLYGQLAAHLKGFFNSLRSMHWWSLYMQISQWYWWIMARVLPTQKFCVFWAHMAWIYVPFSNFMCRNLTVFLHWWAIFIQIDAQWAWAKHCIDTK